MIGVWALSSTKFYSQIDVTLLLNFHLILMDNRTVEHYAKSKKVRNVCHGAELYEKNAEIARQRV